jgi:hypothetical protein
MRGRVARGLTSLTGKRAMCERCNEIDVRVDYYRQLARGVTDKAALGTINSMIADTDIQKRALHPKPE